MGVGFRLTPNWGSPMQSHSVTNSPSRFSSFSVRGRETSSINLRKLSFLSVVSEDGDILCKCSSKSYSCSSALQTLENDCLQIEGEKTNVDKRSNIGINSMMDTDLFIEEGILPPTTHLRDRTRSRFSLLLDNLEALEKSFADSDAMKLERDILLQLGRLGALNFFNACLSRTPQPSSVLDLSAVPTESIGESKTDGTSDDLFSRTIVQTGKKEERKCRRERAALKIGNKATSFLSPSKTIQKDLRKPALSPTDKTSDSRRERSVIARNEAEMSNGVKVVSDLERIRTALEQETGQAVSLSHWAEAAGLSKKVLQQHLRFGQYCRDELIRSTRSLVLYLARNYRGMGVAREDLLQAGNLGVLQGAQSFDPTRGYRFSTYVQYWIRKSMSRTVERHARGIQIPYALSRAISNIQKARKVLSNSHGKYPDDSEVAKFTGLSMAKIESADKCFRVMASIDQKMGYSLNAKYSEFINDTTIQNPKEVVMRQQMRKNIYELLMGLDSRERQLLFLRYGFKDHQPKSLAEIGRLFHVSKECVRKMEKKVMTRLRDEETRRNLSHYMNL